MSAESISLVVRPSGKLQYLYNERIDLSALGSEMQRPRLSHIEPTEELSDSAWDQWGVQQGLRGEGAGRAYGYFLHLNAWWADLTPCGGPVLGPFAKRSEALAAEEEAVIANILLQEEK